MLIIDVLQFALQAAAELARLGESMHALHQYAAAMKAFAHKPKDYDTARAGYVQLLVTLAAESNEFVEPSHM